MSTHAATFQEALDIIESLPEDQQEDLMGIVRRRQSERRREALAKSVDEARKDYERGQVRRGTVDDLLSELEA